MGHEETKVLYPRPRWLDSEIVEVKHGGQLTRRCFTDLTTEEQANYLSTLAVDEIKKLCLLMAGAVRGIGDIYGLSFVGEDGNEDH